ncbi:uncharacterized protein K452DRAFT_301293 [Aplosporella prunicola CBS 121167]|uniref:Uncharacterized protein n=1 Tax=Aplosporella prunicola CBS 121167 TaxID=1176127 RepID=A0A6A6B5U6_9PEZI|nr:uncharacterized protein K452DRAFT_301293 [Aplosporella prunicola CBS 121167]KAF2138347.1 hypothetical protein K452DRAFT_301293 [Aplosporella prunicola CBS 121167]
MKTSTGGGVGGSVGGVRLLDRVQLGAMGVEGADNGRESLLDVLGRVILIAVILLILLIATIRPTVLQTLRRLRARYVRRRKTLTLGPMSAQDPIDGNRGRTQWWL